MSILRRWIARLRGLVAGERQDRELAEEMETHLQMQIEGNLRRGMPLEAARRDARVRAGGIANAQEEYRDQRGIPSVAGLLQDLRFAGRVIRRNPGFASVIVLSLALAIGSNTAVFSLTNAVFLRTLPVAQPEELVLFRWIGSVKTTGYDGSMVRTDRPDEVIGTSFAMPFFEHVRSDSGPLSGVFAFAPIEQLNVIDAGEARIARGQMVTGEYYTTLGVRAALGRTILPADDRAGAEPVAVLTHGHWESRFGGDSSVVGRRLTINGASTTIIGVTPPGFVGTLDVGSPAELTLPMSFAELISDRRGDRDNAKLWWAQMIGRRRTGVSEARAEQELDLLFQRTARDAGVLSEPADTSRGSAHATLDLAPGGYGLDDERRDYERPLTLLTLGAALLLAIACVNAALLLMTRATVRQKEITVRVAMGASRWRIVRQLLVEGLMLVLAAEALGFVFARWTRSLLVTLRPDTANVAVSFDLRVLAVATAISVATALLFGLWPALRATRVDVASQLKSAARTIKGGARSLVTRGLIVAQVAMSVVLLVGAALFLGTLYNIGRIDVGFDQERLLLFRVDPRLSGYAGPRTTALYRELRERLGSLPGVERVTFSRHGQLGGGGRSGSVYAIGTSERERLETPVNVVGTDFFETMRLPLLRGRAFQPGDEEVWREDTAQGRPPLVVVVNASLARRLFGDEDPIGRRVHYEGTEAEVIGVATDAKYFSIRRSADPTLYISFLQYERGQAAFVLRTTGDPRGVIPLVRQAVSEVDPTLPIFDIATQRDVVNTTLGSERLLAKLATAFGSMALILACIGIYALVSYTTAQRTGEIGIRMALGATGRSIFWLVTRGTAALITLGVFLGLMGGVAGARLFEALLYGLTATNPMVLLGVVSVVATVALAAVGVPARRAERVSPLVAIRHDG